MQGASLQSSEKDFQQPLLCFSPYFILVVSNDRPLPNTALACNCKKQELNGERLACSMHKKCQRAYLDIWTGTRFIKLAMAFGFWFLVFGFWFLN